MQVDLTSWLPYILIFIAALSTGLVIYARSTVKGWLDAHATFLDAKTRETAETLVDQLVEMGLSVAQTKLTDEVKTNLKVPVNSWLAEQAGQIAADHAPDYFASALGVDTPEEAAKLLAQRALAKLPVVK